MAIRFDNTGPLGTTREDLAGAPLSGMQMLIVGLITARGGGALESDVLDDVAAWQRQHGAPTREAVVEFLRSDFSIAFGLRVAARRFDADRARRRAAVRGRRRPPTRGGAVPEQL